MSRRRRKRARPPVKPVAPRKPLNIDWGIARVGAVPVKRGVYPYWI